MVQRKIKRLFKKYTGKLFLPDAQLSYAQFGEDLIMAHFFAQAGIAQPSYLDIGANEPRYISNTYFFYEKGASGVLIEPNPYLAKKLSKFRKNDTVVNAGIGLTDQAAADFYLFPNQYNGLSTFSKEEAEHWAHTGMKGLGKVSYEKVIQMPLLAVNDILQKYFTDRAPHILSLDVEGLDLQILQSLDFNRWQPAMICVETLQYDSQQNGFKNNSIISFMQEKNYAVYADTWVNTLFCKKELITK